MTGQRYLELKRLQANLLIPFYRGSLEQRLDAEEKLYQLKGKYGSVQVSLSREEKETLIELSRVMNLYSKYQESGSAMEQSEIYEQFKAALKLS
ncbi:hypothetical protein A8990_106119 [Paenibacillus taihuensis]|uniref:Uncharacterized protein n=1 Tax=Paenibacillus taihuensis TaxID=1156355 RepID=A0A3D9SBF1_9BACL|nr:hypothetical protein [Paenibacillus taihuensis]REE90614.1 hypothetical protein A8990_106119 [Paenibacillus taihuensis]